MIAGTDFRSYQVIRPIGQGGMAQIYLCRKTSIGGFERRVVLKVLHSRHVGDTNYVEMFLEEARLLAKLRHPNIVDISEVDCVGGVPYLVMEYIEGPTLGRIFSRARRAGLEDLNGYLYILQQVAEGLGFAHKRGIVHRDISGHNILLDVHSDTAKLIDFGIAKGEGTTLQTEVGVLKGKLQYMAPELLQGVRADARSDVFSMGVLLYRACFGDFPFRPGPDLWAERMRGELLPIPRTGGLDPGIATVLEQALAPDPAHRHQDASELADALMQQVRSRRVFGEHVTQWIEHLFEDEEGWEGHFGQDTNGSGTHASMERLIQVQDDVEPQIPSPWPRRWLFLTTFSVVSVIIAMILFTVAIRLSGILDPEDTNTDTISQSTEPTKDEATLLLATAEELVDDGEFEAAFKLMEEAMSTGNQDPAVRSRIVALKARIEQGRVDALVEGAPPLVDDPPGALEEPGEVDPALAELEADLRRITLASTPPGEVFVDGAPVGATPTVLEDLEDGPHRIEIRLEGHVTELISVTIPRPESASGAFDVEMMAEPPHALPPDPAPEVLPAPTPIGTQIYRSTFALSESLRGVRVDAQAKGMSEDLARGALDELTDELVPRIEAGQEVPLDSERVLGFLMAHHAEGTRRRELLTAIRKASRDGLLD